MVDTLYMGFALRGQPRQNQRSRSPQVGGHDRRPPQLTAAAHAGCPPHKTHIGSHAYQLEHMHEPVFKNGFLHHAEPVCHAHERHELRLHVGGKSRIRMRNDIGGLKVALIAYAGSAFFARNMQSHITQFLADGIQRVIRTIFDKQVAAGYARRHHKGSRLDAVRHDAVFATMQAFHTPYAYDICALPCNIRSAGAQEVGQIDDLRLACRIFQYGFAFGQRGGHQQVFGTANGGKVKPDMRPLQLTAAAHYITGIKLEFRTHFFQRAQVQVHRTGSYGAAARICHPRFAQPRQQRTQT